MCSKQEKKVTADPATLVAIVIAARRAGNRQLERRMRRELEEDFQVSLRFADTPKPTRRKRP